MHDGLRKEIEHVEEVNIVFGRATVFDSVKTQKPVLIKNVLINPEFIQIVKESFNSNHHEQEPEVNVKKVKTNSQQPKFSKFDKLREKERIKEEEEKMKPVRRESDGQKIKDKAYKSRKEEKENNQNRARGFYEGSYSNFEENGQENQSDVIKQSTSSNKPNNGNKFQGNNKNQKKFKEKKEPHQYENQLNNEVRSENFQGNSNDQVENKEFKFDNFGGQTIPKGNQNKNYQEKNKPQGNKKPYKKKY